MICGKIIYGNKMLIKENTLCYTSQRGHKNFMYPSDNNFWYPTKDRLMIKEGCTAQELSWIGGGGKVPIKILKSCLVPINVTASTTDNACPPSKNDYTIVWIDKTQ